MCSGLARVRHSTSYDYGWKLTMLSCASLALTRPALFRTDMTENSYGSEHAAAIPKVVLRRGAAGSLNSATRTIEERIINHEPPKKQQLCKVEDRER